MTRPRRWHGALICVLSCAFGAMAQEPPQASNAPASTPQRLWITPLDQPAGRGVTISVRTEPEYTLPATIHIECDLESRDAIDHVLVSLRVLDAEGTPAYESQLATDLEQGMSPCLFTWDADGLKDGAYRIEIAAERTSKARIASVTLLAEALSEGNVQASLAAAESAVAATTRTLDTLSASGKSSRYGAVRTAVATDLLPRARAAYAEGDWRRAQTSARAIGGAMRQLALEMAFRGTMGGKSTKPEPGVSRLSVRDGNFCTEAGDAVFLLGAYGGDELADLFPALHRYGLNLGVYSIGPDRTLTGPEISSEFRGALSKVFNAAESSNTSVAVQLAPHAAPAWVLDKWPALSEKGGGNFPYDVTLPQARNVIEAHTKAVVEQVAAQSMLNSIILAENPEFRMEGDGIRNRFIASVREMYSDHNTMNRLWRTRYLDFDEITLDWTLDRPPYQYDLQMYHRNLGTEFLEWMANTARSSAGGVPVQVACSDHVFQAGEALSGIDREALAHGMDIQGCTTLSAPRGPGAAGLIGEHGMYYALLHSMNPHAPVFDSACGLRLEPRTDPGAVLRTLALDAFMSGADAVALSFQPAADSPHVLLDDPRAMDGLGTACLDANRLSAIVSAFQNAPAPVAILWSTSSQIYKQGEPFIHSVRDAYLGCSTFGYAVRFITEAQCAKGELEGVRILVIPAVLALTDEAFTAVDAYIENGGVTIRTGEPVPYNPHGHSRTDTLATSARTVYLRGSITPKSYLHAMDSANDLLDDTRFPRPINANGYPLEGVKSRYHEIDGVPHLYLVNLREAPVETYLQGGYRTGGDLLSGGPVAFPGLVPPFSPMLIRLDTLAAGEDPATAAAPERTIPSADVEPVSQEPEQTREKSPGKTSGHETRRP